MKKILKGFKITLNMIKTLFLLFFLLLHGYFCTAQDDDGKDKDIEAVRMAYITNQLKLSPEEAQKFWPVFNSYTKEIRQARKENPNDIVDTQEKIVNIRKRYKIEFKKVFGSDERVNQTFKAENDFKIMLRNEYQKRHPNANNRQSIQQFQH